MTTNLKISFFLYNIMIVVLVGFLYSSLEDLNSKFIVLEEANKLLSIQNLDLKNLILNLKEPLEPVQLLVPEKRDDIRMLWVQRALFLAFLLWGGYSIVQFGSILSCYKVSYIYPFGVEIATKITSYSCVDILNNMYRLDVNTGTQELQLFIKTINSTSFVPLEAFLLQHPELFFTPIPALEVGKELVIKAIS